MAIDPAQMATDHRYTSSRISSWMRLVQANLADVSPAERQRTLLEELRGVVMKEATPQRRRSMLDEVEAQFPVVPWEATESSTREPIDLATIDAESLATSLLGRAAQLPERSRRALAERLGADSQLEAKVPPDLDAALRALLDLPEGEKTSVAGIAQALIGLLSAVKGLQATFDARFRRRLAETLVAHQAPALGRSASALVRDIVTGTGDAAENQAELVRTVTAIRSVLESVETGLSRLPDRVNRVMPDAIVREVQEAAAEKASFWGIKGGPGEKEFWSRYREIAKDTLDEQALRTAYLDEIFLSAADSYVKRLSAKSPAGKSRA